jgi:RNA polymerase sigma-70 factor (ECF subfamily)
LVPGIADGRPAALVYDTEGGLMYFALVEWSGGEIARIVDFRYARYVMEDAEVAPLS